MKLAFEGSRAELEKQAAIMNKNLKEALDAGKVIIPVAELYKGTCFEDQKIDWDHGFIITDFLERSRNETKA